MMLRTLAMNFSRIFERKKQDNKDVKNKRIGIENEQEKYVLVYSNLHSIALTKTDVGNGAKR